MLKNGKPYIGDREDFVAKQNDLEDALGGGPMLVRNNQILTQTDLSVEPRTGIGMNEQGKMYFIVVDGRSFYYSNGCTITQLGQMLKACGSTIAINVDGGGSSTFMIKHPWRMYGRCATAPATAPTAPLATPGWSFHDKQFQPQLT